jgi:hypothetical protein
MDRAEWELQISEQRPVQKLDVKLFLQRLRARENLWWGRTSRRVGRTPSPILMYRNGIGLVDDGTHLKCITPQLDAYTFDMAVTYAMDNQLTLKHIPCQPGVEQVLFTMYQITTRDNPASNVCPPHFVHNAAHSQIL